MCAAIAADVATFRRTTTPKSSVECADFKIAAYWLRLQHAAGATVPIVDMSGIRGVGGGAISLTRGCFCVYHLHGRYISKYLNFLASSQSFSSIGESPSMTYTEKENHASTETNERTKLPRSNPWRKCNNVMAMAQKRSMIEAWHTSPMESRWSYITLEFPSVKNAECSFVAVTDVWKERGLHKQYLHVSFLHPNPK